MKSHVLLTTLLRQLANTSVLRQAIGSLDLAGVTVIAVSYLELAGSPVELRYLTKRLRQRAPGEEVIVGVCPEREAALSDTGRWGRCCAPCS